MPKRTSDISRHILATTKVDGPEEMMGESAVGLAFVARVHERNSRSQREPLSTAGGLTQAPDHGLT